MLKTVNIFNNYDVADTAHIKRAFSMLIDAAAEMEGKLRERLLEWIKTGQIVNRRNRGAGLQQNLKRNGKAQMKRLRRFV